MLDKKKICLLIIDMQNDFLNPVSPLFVGGGPAIIENLYAVLEFFRQNNLQRIFVRRLHRQDGSDVDKSRIELFRKTGGFLIEGSKGAEIVNELKPLPNEIIITKKRWSAFFKTELDLILRRGMFDTLIIGGVQTPNCIRATAVDAISLDYNVILLEDGTASNSPEIQRANLSDLKNMGAETSSTLETITMFNK
jgi:nicotinamidase-related amidase